MSENLFNDPRRSVYKLFVFNRSEYKKKLSFKKQLYKKCKYECTMKSVPWPQGMK